MRKLLPFALLALISCSSSAWGQDYLKSFPHNLETRYFQFYFRQNEMKVCQIARFADQYISIINRDFFKADFPYPMKALVLEDEQRFGEYLRTELHENMPTPFGIYLFDRGLFATYESSGLGTFAHEILHPLVEGNLQDRPLWAMEGIPTFFEKFYGYWEGDKLVVYWGYQNPWRIALIGDGLKNLDLVEIVNSTNSQGRYRESDLRMVSMFLWDQGKFQKFLRLIQQKNRNGFPSYLEAAFEMPLNKIVPLWNRYLAEVDSQREQIKNFPSSTILPNRYQFQDFMNHFGLKYDANHQSTGL